MNEPFVTEGRRFLFEERRYIEARGAAYYLDAETSMLMTCPVNADGTPDTFYGVQTCVTDLPASERDVEFELDLVADLLTAEF